jgi:2-polyprenyl-6-methoxyphenol hydroxylase-like FAD-dependent oxidoreductase
MHTSHTPHHTGVNSCFEDVAVLERALDETSDGTAAHAQGVQGSGTSSAVQRYTELRAADAEALVKLSHSLDGGFLTFVGPLILDSLLHRLAPALFSPNIIASLQNEQWSFSRIRARKRVDRALQVLLLGGLAAAVVRIVGALLAWVSKLVLAARVA